MYCVWTLVGERRDELLFVAAAAGEKLPQDTDFQIPNWGNNNNTRKNKFYTFKRFKNAAQHVFLMTPRVMTTRAPCIILREHRSFAIFYSYSESGVWTVDILNQRHSAGEDRAA